MGQEYVTEDMFELLAKNMAKKFNLSVGVARQKVLEALTANGIHVGLPLVERIRLAQTRAGERAVIESLHEKGLLDSQLKGG